MRAFSLIELLVVVSILAIIASVAVPAYNNYKMKANIGRAFAILDGLRNTALVNYQRTGYVTGSSATSNFQILSITDPFVSQAFIKLTSDATSTGFCVSNYPNAIGLITVNLVNANTAGTGLGSIGLVANLVGDTMTWPCVIRNGGLGVDPRYVSNMNCYQCP